MNSLAIFQTIINEILQNLINIEKQQVLLIILQQGQRKNRNIDKIVEKVVKRLVENKLYIKPEKCKWKIRKVKFLKVVIELERIKIEKEKMKRILDWLTLKENNLMKKDQKQDWTEKQKKIFRKLKKKFTKEPVLVALDLDKNKNRSKCIRLCNRRSIIYEV